MACPDFSVDFQEQRARQSGRIYLFLVRCSGCIRLEHLQTSGHVRLCPWLSATEDAAGLVQSMCPMGCCSPTDT